MITQKECFHCESKYTVEYEEDSVPIMSDEPSYCPFCGEIIEEDDFNDVLDLDDKGLDLDSDE